MESATVSAVKQIRDNEDILLSRIEPQIKQQETKLESNQQYFRALEIINRDLASQLAESQAQATLLSNELDSCKLLVKNLSIQNEVQKKLARDLGTKLADSEALARDLKSRLEESEERARDLASRLTQSEAQIKDLQTVQESQPFWLVSKAEIHITEEEKGKGGWGSVRIAEFRGQRVAAKMLYDQIISKNNLRLFTREMTMSARVHHPHIVQFIGASTEGVPIILLELMSTSLRSQLAVGPLSTKQVLSIASDVSRALNYLHLTQPRSIIHRDVSTANILLEPSPPPTVWKAKLSDFGSTNFVSVMATTGPGNPLYAAPEAFNPYQQTPKMDVFSFGIVLIEAFTREMPSADDRIELIEQISWRAIVPLIHHCIEMNQDKRPTMEAILAEFSRLQQTLQC